jgi:hypothetical protein
LRRANAATLLTINGSNELINLGGGLGSRYADVHAARHRAGDRLDDHIVRVFVRRRLGVALVTR